MTYKEFSEYRDKKYKASDDIIKMRRNGIITNEQYLLIKEFIHSVTDINQVTEERISSLLSKPVIACKDVTMDIRDICNYVLFVGLK